MKILIRLNKLKKPKITIKIQKILEMFSLEIRMQSYKKSIYQNAKV